MIGFNDATLAAGPRPCPVKKTETHPVKTLLAAASALALITVAGAADAQSWADRTRQDLTAAHANLRDNHPGAVVQGPAGDAFRSWLDAGLAEANEMTSRANSGDAQAYLLRWYGRGFHDSSTAIRPTFETLDPWFATAWPGVATGWRNGAYVVTHVKEGVRRAPPLGAQLVSCNGVSAEDMAQDRLDGWEADLSTEAGRIRSAPYLLWNRNNAFTGAGVPQSCRFKVGRREREFRLETINGDLAGQEVGFRSAMYWPSAQPLGVEQVDGRTWIHVHSLADDAGWEAFYAQVESQIDAVRSPNGLVIDLRGANGAALNATARGYVLANTIWTPEFTVSRQPPAEEITYRATPGNRQWFVDTLGRMEADPAFVANNMPIIENTREIVAAFDRAIAANQPSFTLNAPAPAADTGAPNPVQGNVVVLVDSGCSGGCLDILDLLTRLPNVRTAGQPTDVYSMFVEPTVVRLPSNYTELTYGHKAWAGRADRHNQPVTPQVAYTGEPTDEQAVRTWVSSLFGA